MTEAVGWIKDLGFPIFVAVFVLCRLEPAIKRLDQSITTLTVVTAKSNGMKANTVEDIVSRVMAKRTGKRRRASDVLSDSEE
jgi:hypothetical protein